jgi:uncharacterized protein (DUF362 family)
MKGEKKVEVSIVQDAEVEVAVRKAIDLLGGIENFVKPQDKVVIKPNLVFALRPFTGFTTDPTVIQAIVKLCQQVNPLEVVIAEGSGGIDTSIAFLSCGYTEYLRDYDVRFVDLNTAPTTKVKVPEGVSVTKLDIPDIILESDALINVPKLKLYRRIPNQRDWASLAVKNLLGAIPGKGAYSSTRPSGMTVECSQEFWTLDGDYYHPVYRQWWRPQGERKRIHANLAQGLVDVNKVIKPALNLIDAFVVSDDINMTTTKAEKPFALNTILACQDPVALDFVATKISGINPSDTLYLKCAAERGIGESDYDMIQLLGTPLKKIIRAWDAALKSK